MVVTGSHMVVTGSHMVVELPSGSSIHGGNSLPIFLIDTVISPQHAPCPDQSICVCVCILSPSPKWVDMNYAMCTSINRRITYTNSKSVGFVGRFFFFSSQCKRLTMYPFLT